MTTTTETIASLTDAMTAADLNAHQSAVAKIIGASAHVHIGIGWGDTPAYISVAPHGICKDEDRAVFTAATWPRAFAEAYDFARNYAPVRRNATIRKMALAIIELTDEHGKCIEARLVARGFDAQTIRELHATACQRASEMCANAPFCVVMAETKEES